MVKKSKNKSMLHTFLIYSRFTLKYRLLFTIILLLLPVVVICGQILVPMIYADAVDTVSQLAGSNQSFWPIFSGLVIKSVSLLFIVWLSWRAIGFSIATLEFRVKRDLEQHIFKHLTSHSYGFHTNSFSGSLVAQTNRMTTAYERLFDTLFFNFGRMIILTTVALYIIFSKSITLGLIILSWVILYTALMTFLQIKKLPYAKAAAAEDSKVTANLADSLTNIFAIITFGHKNIERLRFNKTSQKRYRIALKDWYITESIFALQGFLIFVVEATVIWTTIALTLGGKLTIGDIVLVQLYIIGILNYIWEFGRALRNIERAFADAHEMTVILNQTETVKDPANPEPAIFNNGVVKFSKVSYGYDKSLNLLNDFNFDIRAGEHIGLVGPSGGGKTTITKLLLRLMDIQKGDISIDGQDITKIAQDDLRKNIAYVPQEPILFHRSIAENISYGNPDASLKDIKQAAHLAKADEFIVNLKNGYDTLVGERGIKLSGGQKQRIAIARAMLKKSKLLVLDEATSALDSESEAAIQDALWELMQNRTAIVIAHRLSTVQKMDRIIVINDGKIIEQGSHNELKVKNGLYAKLWSHQSGGFIK